MNIDIPGKPLSNSILDGTGVICSFGITMSAISSLLATPTTTNFFRLHGRPSDAESLTLFRHSSSPVEFTSVGSNIDISISSPSHNTGDASTVSPTGSISNLPFIATEDINTITPTESSGTSPLPVASSHTTQALAPILGGVLGCVVIIAMLALYLVVKERKKRKEALSREAKAALDAEAPLPDATRRSVEIWERECSGDQAAPITVGDEGSRRLGRNTLEDEPAAPTQDIQESKDPSYVEGGTFNSTIDESFEHASGHSRGVTAQETYASEEESSRAVQELLKPEEVTKLRQLLAAIQPSSQASSTSASQADLQEIREEMQRLRHLVVLQPPPIPQRSESDVRSWTTSLPPYDS